jgi:hypothetical protein
MFFKNFKRAIIVCSGLQHPTEQVQILKNVPDNNFSLQRNRLLYLTEWAALPSQNISRNFFLRADKTPEKITRLLFLTNMKGFILQMCERAVVCCRAALTTRR